ncbi:hypothetical protein TWF281_005280 [Arthrobotrys megalospora]
MVKASRITKRKRKPSTQVPYGSGYVTESHSYGPRDIYKTVKYYPKWPKPSVTGYYIDYPSLKERRLGQSPREMLARWRFPRLSFLIYAKVDGEYMVVLEVTADGDDTLDDLVDQVIVSMHDLTYVDRPQNILPRREGFSFDLQYKGSSLFQKINTNNRQFGERIWLQNYFRGEPNDAYELVWKEYDARGREHGSTLHGGQLCPIIDLTSELDIEDENEEDDGEKVDAEIPRRVLRRPTLGSNIISLLSSSPPPSDTSQDT